MSFTTIPEMFQHVVEKYRENPHKAAYSHKLGETYEDISYGELSEQVEAFAAGLHKLGIGSGSRVGIISENRLEWIIADFASVGLGAADVPVFPTLTAAQIAYIFAHAETDVIIASNKMQLDKVRKVRAELPHLQHVIVMNAEAIGERGEIPFAEVSRLGRESRSPEERRAWFRERCLTIRPQDLLTIIYTSGTTGNPKGVMLSNRNLVTNILGARRALEILESDVLLSYLPLCHSYERMAGYYTAFSCGARLAFAQSIETVAGNLQEVRPTLMTSVPRLFERIQARILANVEREKPAKQKIFHWGITVGKRYARARKSGTVNLGLTLQHTLADRLVFAKVRARTGGRLRYFVSGGAALAREIGEFFEAIGLVILEGYGLTESSPVISFNRVDSYCFGSVGKALDNVEVRIAADGEILARGGSIMMGYLKDEEATRACIDSEGWLHTGDIGTLDSEGILTITDRKKSIFVSSGGKNIAPQPIENALTQSRFVDQVMLIGEMRDYCTALVVPNFEALSACAAALGIRFGDPAELTKHAEIIREVQRDIDRVLADFSKYEKVRRFVLLADPFSVENGQMTPTLKVKRRVVEAHYAEHIEAMYT